MSNDEIEVTPDVISAHEAGHAVAAIVFGASFSGIKIQREGHAVAQVRDIGGLSDLGKARTFLAGTAGEEVALGKPDLRLSSMDRRLLAQAITDCSVLEYADLRAVELIQKYRTAHDAVRRLIHDEIRSGTNDVIPADVVIEVARLNGAALGAEEQDFPNLTFRYARLGRTPLGPQQALVATERADGSGKPTQFAVRSPQQR